MKHTYYQLGKMQFDTKKQIHTYYSDMLHNQYSLNEKLNREDSEQLYHLLKYHPNFDEKVGVGVKFFRVETAVQENVKWAKCRAFYIHRHDGTKVNFSIKACYRFKDQIPKLEA